MRSLWAQSSHLTFSLRQRQLCAILDVRCVGIAAHFGTLKWDWRNGLLELKVIHLIHEVLMRIQSSIYSAVRHMFDRS